MAEEEDPWGFDEAEATTEQPAIGDAAAAGGDAAAPAGEPAGGEQAAEELPPPPPAEDDHYRKPVQLYKHWVRPKFLQYRYMYNYRTNYYDDVIDYLDMKQRGLSRDIPRAQTWAERVLRANVGSGSSLDLGRTKHRDVHLVQTLAASVRAYNYHTKAYINRKYSSVL